jgi:hypothetical protein
VFIIKFMCLFINYFVNLHCTVDLIRMLKNRFDYKKRKKAVQSIHGFVKSCKLRAKHKLFVEKRRNERMIIVTSLVRRFLGKRRYIKLKLAVATIRKALKRYCLNQVSHIVILRI